jgi:competence protein ComEC
VLLLLLVAGIFAVWWRGRDDRRLRVWLLDVGQGECIVARENGRTIVVDGGSSDRADVARSTILPFLQMQGVRRIDALFVSHPDDDHFNALPEVIREIPVARLYLAPRILDAAQPLLYADAWRRFLRDCRARGTQILPLEAPQVLALGDAGANLPLRVLWPKRDSKTSAGTNTNSLVLKIERGASSILLTGDADLAVEDALHGDAAAQNITVLKVGHHGSKTASSEAFLRQARPHAAVISCGRYNSFGHPSAAVLERLATLGIPTKRTDLDGTIEIECDDSSCQISSFR